MKELLPIEWQPVITFLSMMKADKMSSYRAKHCTEAHSKKGRKRAFIPSGTSCTPPFWSTSTMASGQG